ncbi:uncharacterized protein [Aegilops tauschii subsp. strangulata]|uniref:uncharacterized protein isoform X2 n=1 Tax=Triticum aestivum TaxID=4565 RepID=UPI00098A613A|nr:uncharacterized protein LOC123077534 isoform X2 [Triticum aestivum]XP_045088007.1 uncharacterized protein LOC109786715 isoform X2 [Aegilops tauschii subsp. strangulata]
MGRDTRCAVCSEATSGWTTRVRLGKAPDEMSTDDLELDGRGGMGRDTRCALKLLAAGQGEHIALARPVELQASLRIAGGEAVPRNQAFEKIADLFYGPRKNW